MTSSELCGADLSRVRSLCSASMLEAKQVCSRFSMGDPVALHCARLSLHFVLGIALPEEYAWTLLEAPQFHDGFNEYEAPLHAHVLLLSMYAADFELRPIDLVNYCRRFNPTMRRAVSFRVARSPAALGDDRLATLSESADPDVRLAVADVLGDRDCAKRREVLMRLLVDPVIRVKSGAARAAARSGDPVLADLLAKQGDLFALSFVGDKRAWPRAQKLAMSDDPLDGEEAVATALAIGDRTLLLRLLAHPEWDTRQNAVLSAASRRMLHAEDLDDVISREPAPNLAALARDWPHWDAAGLARLATALCKPSGPLPEREALGRGRSDAVEEVRNLAKTEAIACGAAVRLMPVDVAVSLVRELAASERPDLRSEAAAVVASMALTDCYPLLSELCVDDDSAVAKSACRCVYWRKNIIRVGLFGLDTAVLRAANDLSRADFARLQLPRVVESILRQH